MCRSTIHNASIPCLTARMLGTQCQLSRIIPYGTSIRMVDSIPMTVRGNLQAHSCGSTTGRTEEAHAAGPGIAGRAVVGVRPPITARQQLWWRVNRCAGHARLGHGLLDRRLGHAEARYLEHRLVRAAGPAPCAASVVRHKGNASAFTCTPDMQHGQKENDTTAPCALLHARMGSCAGFMPLPMQLLTPTPIADKLHMYGKQCTQTLSCVLVT